MFLVVFPNQNMFLSPLINIICINWLHHTKLITIWYTRVPALSPATSHQVTDCRVSYSASFLCHLLPHDWYIWPRIKESEAEVIFSFLGIDFNPLDWKKSFPLLWLGQVFFIWNQLNRNCRSEHSQKIQKLLFDLYRRTICFNPYCTIFYICRTLPIWQPIPSLDVQLSLWCVPVQPRHRAQPWAVWSTVALSWTSLYFHWSQAESLL